MNQMAPEIRDCEVCGARDLPVVLDLGPHPMCDDLVAVGDPRTCREYPIEILYCQACRTAHQRHQVPKQDLFPVTYHYRSRFTADVLNGMRGLVEACERRLGDLTGKVVLDIGCNDGSLLDLFRAEGAATFGIEPTDACKDASANGHTALQEYLSSALAADFVAQHGHPDVITFTNVFAHIEDLEEVLDALSALVGPTTCLVIENHYLGSVLAAHQFDTFYHEHPRTYSYGSFVRIAARLGLDLAAVEFPSRYGGNIRVFLGPADSTTASDVNLAALDVREGQFGTQFDQLRQSVQTWRASKRAQLHELVAAHGALPAKAFPGRAAILVKLLDLDERVISAVYEKPGSLKIGHYVPGTRIEIRSDEELLGTAAPPAWVVNFAWHISGEIRSYLREHGYTGNVVDILSPDDFVQI
jgi:SAM-dependent methyltransferase